MTVETELHAFRDAFNGRDLEATLALFAEHALFEMPLLGQRLFGRAEIGVGLRRIFAVTASAEIELSRSRSTRELVLAEGRLRARLQRDHAPLDVPLGLAAETRHGRIVRLSTYLDAHPYRLWADGPLFAPAGPTRGDRRA